jgi:CMP-N,N'-diacetyllegionaminic acid synthase
MRVLGIIPARGGSKGIPRKNMALLNGKPLLAYTAEAAMRSERLTRVLLSTDDQEIAQYGKSLGVEVPFLRPAKLAQDKSPTIDVLLDVLQRLHAAGEIYDAVFTLQPTNPLRTVADIDGAIELLERTGSDSVISFTEVGGKHPARMKTIDAEGRIVNPPFAEQFEGMPRQSLPKFYLREGSVYLTRAHVLAGQHSFQGKDCRAWIIPEWRACNIDTKFDLFVTERVLRNYDKLAAQEKVELRNVSARA